MRLDAIAIGKNPPEEVNVIVEVPVGGEPIKYEMDKASGTLVVDRFLYTSMRYPGNYGFIPHTLSDDGDPCDVLIANQRGIVPGAVVAVWPVGVLRMQDEAGGDEFQEQGPETARGENEPEGVKCFHGSRNHVMCRTHKTCKWKIAGVF